MNRRDFLKRSSAAALLAAAEWSGVSEVFAKEAKNGTSGKIANKNKENMEQRNLGGMSTSAIGLGCLLGCPVLCSNFQVKKKLILLLTL